MKLLNIGLFIGMLSFLMTANSYAQTNTIDSLTNLLAKESYNIEILNELGSSFEQKEDFPNALHYFKQMQEASEASNDTISLIRSTSLIGSIYRRITNYDKAQSMFMECLKLSEIHSKKESYASVLTNIGVVYTDLGDNSKALSFLFKGLEFIKKQDSVDLNEEVKIYNNIATAYGSMDSLDAANLYFEKALKILQELNNYELMGAIMNNIGVNKMKVGDYEEALLYFRKAIVQFESIQVKFGIAMSLDNIGLVKYKQGFIQQAIDTTLLSAKIYSNLGSIINTRDKYNRLIELYKIKGENEIALDYFLMWQNLNDSLDESEMKARVHEVEQKYEIEKIELEHQNKLDFIKHKQEVTNYKWLLLTSILFLVLLIISFFWYSFKNKHKIAKIKLEKSVLKRKRMEEEINYKNNELSTFASYITKKKELMGHITDTINNSTGIDTQAKKDIVKEIKLSLKTDSDNKDFDVYIKQLHESFLYKLQSKFPNISERESQLCVLLMLELSSKEIASVMNITLGSVETARSRIRKKLEISSEIKIPIFLKQL